MGLPRVIDPAVSASNTATNQHDVDAAVIFAVKLLEERQHTSRITKNKKALDFSLQCAECVRQFGVRGYGRLGQPARRNTCDAEHSGV